jgi:hypothetical protein
MRCTLAKVTQPGMLFIDNNCFASPTIPRRNPALNIRSRQFLSVHAHMGLPLDRLFYITGATPHSPGNASVSHTTARSERGLSARVAERMIRAKAPCASRRMCALCFYQILPSSSPNLALLRWPSPTCSERSFYFAFLRFLLNSLKSWASLK